MGGSLIFGEAFLIGFNLKKVAVCILEFIADFFSVIFERCDRMIKVLCLIFIRKDCGFR